MPFGDVVVGARKTDLRELFVLRREQLFRRNAEGEAAVQRDGDGILRPLDHVGRERQSAGIVRDIEAEGFAVLVKCEERGKGRRGREVFRV